MKHVAIFLTGALVFACLWLVAAEWRLLAGVAGAAVGVLCVVGLLYATGQIVWDTFGWRWKE